MKILNTKLRYLLALASLTILITFTLPITQALAAAQICTWEGDSGNSWSTATNWSCAGEGARVPADGDSLVFPTTVGGSITPDNDIAGLDLKKITISGNSYTITGLALELTSTAAEVLLFPGTSNAFNIDTSINTGSGSPTIYATGNSNNIGGNIALNAVSTLNVGADLSNTLAIAGNISGTATNVLISNALGTVVYGGTNTYTSTNGNFINEGSSVICSNNSCFGNSSNDVTTTGAAEITTAGARTIANRINLNAGTGTPTITAQNNLTLNGILDINTDSEIIEGDISSNRTILAGASAVDIAANQTLTLTGDGNLSNATFIFSSIEGSGDLVIQDGLLELNSNPTYAGEITIKSDGFINNSPVDGFGTTASGIIIENGGVLRTSSGGTFTIDDDITVEGTGNTSGPYNQGSIYCEAGELIINGDISLSGDTTFINTSDTDSITLNGAISGTGNLKYFGDATNGGFDLEGTAPNDYVGITTIESSFVAIDKPNNVNAIPGDLDIIGGAANAVLFLGGNDENISDDATITMDPGTSDAEFIVQDSITETVGIIKGDGVINLGNNTPIIKVGADNESGIFAGEISSNDAEIEKVGTGTWDLQGTNVGVGGGFTIYRVSAGRFLLNFADTSGAFSPFVVNGGILGGNDVIGPLTATGGSVAPGNSPGCLNPAGPLTFNSGTSLNIEITGSTICTQYDKVAASGAVTLDNARLNITLSYTPTVGTVFTIVEGSSVSGTFNGIANGATVSSGGRLFTVNYNATSVTLSDIGVAPVSTTAIPAAGTLPTTGTSIAVALIALLLIGSGMFIVRRRRNTFYTQ